jgi:hypothetical protein
LSSSASVASSGFGLFGGDFGLKTAGVDVTEIQFSAEILPLA